MSALPFLHFHSNIYKLIYKEYEREISYRIPRSRIRETLAIYFLENHVELSLDEYSGDRTASDMAGAVIRKFLSANVNIKKLHFYIDICTTTNR